MIYYLSFIVLINGFFFLLLHSQREKLNISKKGLIILTGLTFSLSAAFPLALSFLDMVHVIFLVYFIIIIVSIFLGRFLFREQAVENVLVTEENLYQNELIDNQTFESGIEPLEEIAASINEIHEVQVTPEKTEEQVEENGPDETFEEVEIIEEVEIFIESIEEINQKAEIDEEIEEEPTNKEISKEYYYLHEEFDEEEGKEVQDVVILGETIIEEIDPAVGVIAPANGDNMEEYIEQGFNAKFAGDSETAIGFFCKAMEFGPQADLLQMISLDIFSMYKELGKYSEARTFLNRYLEDNEETLSDHIRNDILINIKRVELLEELLAKANSENLPQAMVPQIISITVEERLAQWKEKAFN
ncbi:MAG: hypothetical protein M0Z31_00985 [Clostridia bacterium]|nr:hypothetical protein [Clostridia bacterium]